MPTQSNVRELTHGGGAPTEAYADFKDTQSPLEPYVAKSIHALEHVSAHREGKESVPDKVQEVIRWWHEFQTVIGMYVPADQELSHRLRAALTTRSLTPLFERHISESQYQRLLKAFTGKFDALSTILGAEGTQLPDDLQVEAAIAYDQIYALYDNIYRGNNATR